MKQINKYLLVIFLFTFGCTQNNGIEEFGKHYQSHNDYKSLSKVVELMDLGVDTVFVKSILGEPISMGFDFRYLVDSVGPNGCIIGAVFHISEKGTIDQKWINEICE